MVVKQFLLHIVLLFTVNLGFSQQWRDSLNSARKLYKEGKYIESLDKYKSAQKRAPKNIDLSDEMAQSAYKAREFQKAEKLYSQSSSKKASPKQKAKTYHNIGNAKLQQKKYDEAVEAYKESLRNNPNDEETRYNLAEAMKKQQQNKDNQKKDDKTKDKKNQDQKNQESKQKDKGQQDNKTKDNKTQDSKQQKQNSNFEENAKSQLSDKKTERMLDDLAKKEMETKRKLDANKSKSSDSKTGKDW